MSITTTYVHKVEADFEQFVFPSAVNPDQHHFIDRDQGQPWKLNIVQTEESLSIEELQELRVELADLAAFMVKLEEREIRRTTEPGQPELDGRGGGL